jgi:hypothetical protein
MESLLRSVSQTDGSAVVSGTTAKLSAWEECASTPISIAQSATDVE